MASLWGFGTLCRSTRAGGAAIGSRVTLGEDRERGEKERPAAPDRRKGISGAEPGRGVDACSSMAARPMPGRGTIKRRTSGGRRPLTSERPSRSWASRRERSGPAERVECWVGTSRITARLSTRTRVILTTGFFTRMSRQKAAEPELSRGDPVARWGQSSVAILYHIVIGNNSK